MWNAHCFIRADPLIQHEEILTALMLDSMASLPWSLQDLAHIDDGDGFVSGLLFESRDDSIWLQPGIVKHKNAFFLLRKPLDLGEMISDFRKGSSQGKNFRIMLLDRFDESVMDGVVFTSSPLDILPEDSVQKGLTIGVFSDQSSLKLPNPEEDDPLFEYTQTARLNILETPWSCHGGKSTFHPQVFQAIANSIARKQMRSVADEVLLFAILDKGYVSMPAIRHYIESHNGVWPGEGRREIFTEFCHCLKYVPSFAAAQVGLPPELPKDKIKEPPRFIQRLD